MKKKAYAFEKQMIRQLSSHVSENGYNVAWGGKSGFSGYLSPQAKLSANDVLEIIEAFITNKASISDLAKKFKVSKQTINNVLNRKKYLNVEIGSNLLHQLKKKNKERTVYFVFNPVLAENIRLEYVNNNVSLSFLANKYNTSKNTVSKILNNITYKSNSDITKKACKKIHKNVRGHNKDFVISIFEAFATGNETSLSLSKKLGINKCVIDDILSRKSGKKIKVPSGLLIAAKQKRKQNSGKKYSDDIIFGVLADFKNGSSVSEISKKYSMSRGNVYFLIKGNKVND